MGTVRVITDPELKQNIEGRALSVLQHTKAVSSGLVFSKENRSQDTEAFDKEELMEVIRRKHLSVRNRTSTPATASHGSQLLPTTMECLWTVDASNDGQQ